MSNIEVVKSFIRGEPANSLHLFSTGNKLFSYRTCIAQWVGDYEYLIINNTKYSSTTSKHLGYLKREYSGTAKIFNVDNVPVESSQIITYVNQDYYDSYR